MLAFLKSEQKLQNNTMSFKILQNVKTRTFLEKSE